MLTLSVSVLALALTLETQSSASSRTMNVAGGAPPSVDSFAASIQALEWRNIGPTRGGRSEAVTGVPSHPSTFFFGGAGGGVFRTDDYGLNWTNITDGQLKTSSVGAIAVADSDPNVIYVGMGEAGPRGNTLSHGDGVYKSTDFGKTWVNVGLQATLHISQVRVHPTNPDIVWVSAVGEPHAPAKDRGIYKTVDGGKTWRQTLFVDENTGAIDLSLDVTNPRILYAAMWDFRRFPWQMRSGGAGSGLYKSSDGGETWKKLTEGLPKGTVGKMGVAVSPARPARVYAVIEAEDGGLYRSDNSGDTWTRVNEDRILRARSWYYMHITAHPTDPEVAYVSNAPFLRVSEGGKTVTPISTPHGDNHGVWINPKNPDLMINANDGGANVSVNGGKTWSTQANQITAQIYRVNADEGFPYLVCGGQQDNTSVCVASRSDGAGIDNTSWFTGPGCESAYIAFDKMNPQLIYGGCYTGIIEEYNPRTQRSRNIMAYAQHGLSQWAKDFKFRFNWNAPIHVSLHDPRVIYHAGNQLLRTKDRGATWSVVSPDLTRNEKDKQQAGGAPITNEGAGAEVYGTIFAFSESPKDKDVLWAGTDDGRLHVTRDGGTSWTDVTPPGSADFQFNAVDASPHDAATAYVTVVGYRRGNYTPMAFKTTDFGKTWSSIANGFSGGEFVRVVREDPNTRGLLFAGTEYGAHVSQDGGTSWKSLRLNMPSVAVTDLQIRNGDLIASTQGRGLWILDDITPLQKADGAGPLHLFKPRATVRAEQGQGGAGVGKNPPSGVLIHYSFAKAPEKPVKIEIMDAKGAVVRTATSEVTAGAAPANPFAPPRVNVTAKAGLNRWVWNFRRDDIAKIPGIFYETTAGHREGVGRYSVRVTSGDLSATESFEVVADPRAEGTNEALNAADVLADEIRAEVDSLHDRLVKLRSVRDQVKPLLELTRKHAKSKEIGSAGTALTRAIDSWEETIVQPNQKTQQDVINYKNGLMANMIYLLGEVSEADAPPTSGMRERWNDLRQSLGERTAVADKILGGELNAFNAVFRDAGLAGVLIP